MRQVARGLLITLTAIVLPACVAAQAAQPVQPEGQHPTWNLRAQAANGLSPQALSLKALPTWQIGDDPIPHSFRFTLTNQSEHTVHTVAMGLTFTDREGNKTGFFGFPVEASLAPHQQRYFGIVVTGVEIASDDQVTLAPWPEMDHAVRTSRRQGVEKEGTGCDVWCNSCESKAEGVRTGGVKSFDWSCSPNRCAFTCFPPRI